MSKRSCPYQLATHQDDIELVTESGRSVSRRATARKRPIRELRVQEQLDSLCAHWGRRAGRKRIRPGVGDVVLTTKPGFVPG